MVARVIARPEVPCVWDAVPYFWTDQYDRKFQMCGVAGPDPYRRTTARGDGGVPVPATSSPAC